MDFNKESIKNIPNIAGIYLIRNKVNGKCYIGQSIYLKKRLLHHISNFTNDRYESPLYKALLKYGFENFELEILNTFEGTDYTDIKKQLDILEIKYIKEYNSYGNTGYNQTYGGDAGILGYKMTDNQKDKLSKQSYDVATDGRYLVYCFDIQERVYYSFVNLKKLEEHLNCKFNRGNQLKIQHKRYIIAHNEEDLQEKVKQLLNKRNTKDTIGTIQKSL